MITRNDRIYSLKRLIIVRDIEISLKSLEKVGVSLDVILLLFVRFHVRGILLDLHFEELNYSIHHLV